MDNLNNKNRNIEQRHKPKMDQDQKDNLATSLSQIFGARVVPRTEFEKLNLKNKALLSQLDSSKKSASSVYPKFVKYYCYFLGFKKYHSKWKPFTRLIENRTQKLIDEKVMVNFDEVNLPDDVRTNLKEAYNCYSNNLIVACYVMLLRTIEICVNYIYDPIMNPDKNFVPAKAKLKWVNKQGIIKGADFHVMKGFIEGRNEAIHEVFEPTDKQLLSALETVKTIIYRLN